MRRKLIAALPGGGGVSGRSAEVCGCRAADVGTLLEGFACEEVTIKVANKGQGVMVKENLVRTGPLNKTWLSLPINAPNCRRTSL